MSISTISAVELQQWLASDKTQPVILDVREGWELEICQLKGSLHMPMGEVPSQAAQTLDQDASIVCLCHHGVRSWQVAAYLSSIGFNKVFNLSGGINAWSATVDPDCPTY